MHVLPLLLAFGCTQSPLGRPELVLVSDEQMAELGSDAFQQLRAEQPESTNAQLGAYVDCIARALVAVGDIGTESGVPVDSQEWEVVVFADPQVNAFALPGGKIGVYEGLLQVATSPGELAAVLGHEISHVTARHSAERVSQQSAIDLGVSAIAATFDNETTRSLAIAALGVGSQVGVLLPFSRVQEAEADELGQRLMARAGFDPRESLSLWAKMAMLGQGGTPALLSDHPSDEDRQAALAETLPMALPLYERAQAEGLRPSCSLEY